MLSRPPRWTLQVALALLASTQVVGAQMPPSPDVLATRRALTEASAQADTARRRADGLEAEADRASAEADRAARDAAALAARIQQIQAEIAVGEARLRLIDQQQMALRASLAARELPILRLTAALQSLSRRPLAVTLLRPGSLVDAMHLRALLATLLPEVRRRTADLRAEIERGRQLQAQSRQARLALVGAQQALSDKRQALVALEMRQRIAARASAGNADREAELALAMAEKARDLGALVEVLDKASAMRERLARLPGPVPRPEGAIPANAAMIEAPSAEPSNLPGYGLPVVGRLVSGFGEGRADTASRGISIAARARAQVVTPAPGSVAFAGPFKGYGQIVIVAHPGGWTSLITGLAQVDVKVGDALVAGAPLGLLGPGQPVLTLELRRDGQPVNPLDQIRP